MFLSIKEVCIMKNILHIILPGMLVAATGVGAGDLITAGLAGKSLGIGLIWAPIVGAILKWSLNIGLVRWQLATDTTLMEGWFNHLGRWLRVPFAIYLFLWSFMVGGALITACATAADAMISLGPYGRVLWGIVHSLLGLALVRIGKFDFFEKLMMGLIGLMFCSVLFTAALIFLNNPHVEFNFNFSGNTGWLLGVLGGVGGTLTMMSYGYWIQEEGRAGREGLKICKIDLSVSYIVTAVFSMAMIIIGSRLGDFNIDKANFAITLSQILESKLGLVGRYIFLFGFWGGVFSSLIGVWQSVPYLYADFYYSKNSNHSHKDYSKTKAYGYYAIALAFVPMISLFLKFQAIQLAYAIMGALFMPLLAISLLCLNRKKFISAEFLSPAWEKAILVFTLIFFSITSIIGLL